MHSGTLDLPGNLPISFYLESFGMRPCHPNYSKTEDGITVCSISVNKTEK